MNINELNKKLDISAEIYMGSYASFLKVVRNLNHRIPSRIHESNDETFLNIFLPHDMDIGQYRPLFPMFNIEERERYLIATERIYERNIIELINRLREVDGLIVAGEYIKEGYFVIECFMHHSVQKIFTDVIATKIMGYNVIKKLDIKPINNMFNLYSNIKMKNIILNMPYETFKNDRVAIILRNTNSIGQIVTNPPGTYRFKIVIYSNDDLHNDEGITTISKDDGIYTTNIENDVLFSISKRTDKLKLSSILTFVWIKEERLYINIILPEIRAREYLSAIVSAQMELKRLDLITLENYSDFNIEIMEKYLL